MCIRDGPPFMQNIKEVTGIFIFVKIPLSEKVQACALFSFFSGISPKHGFLTRKDWDATSWRYY